MKYQYKTKESMLKWFNMKDINKYKMCNWSSVFQQKASNYYGFAAKLSKSTIIEDIATIEYYNVENCNFIVSYSCPAMRYAADTIAQWKGNGITNISPEFLTGLFLDVFTLKEFSCTSSLFEFFKTDNPNALMNATGETMMKAKLLSLKYEQYLPVEFWQSVLHEEKNHYYQFLVDNLFNKI